MKNGISLKTLLSFLSPEDPGRVKVFGDPSPEMLIREMVIDSRKAAEGSLFVAFAGERTDGHDYIEKAFAAGASLALGSDEAKIAAADVPEGKGLILVKDTIDAIGRIGHGIRMLFEGPVIGITGSVGKTSTKDLTAAVLSGRYAPLKTLGNLNNEIGVPMTLTRLSQGCFDAAVVEMGLDRKGDIDYYASLAKPEFGIVTNVGTSHIENFESQEGILHAKLEIVAHLIGRKRLYLNGDDPLLYGMKDKLPKDVTVRYFGRSEHSDMRLLEAGRTETGKLFVKARYEEKLYEAEIDTLGLHMAMNVLPGIMAAADLGMTPEEVREGLTRYEATPHRLQRVLTDRFLIIDDTYNASPSSMVSAIDTLMDLGKRGRTVAVLGDIKEMGAFSKAGHREVGAHVAAAGADLLIACGTEGHHIYEAALEAGMPGDRCCWFEDLEALKEALPGLVRDKDTILLKASHSMEFAELVPVLTR